MAERAEAFLKISTDWHELQAPLLGHTLEDFKPLLQRVDPDSVTAMIESGKVS
jgi:methionyl-tRNA synthetase